MTSPQNSPWFESDWLTDQLTAAGCLRRARVTAVSVERIAAEVGFLDSLTRALLTLLSAHFPNDSSNGR